MMFYAYALEKGVQCLILSPNLFVQHGSFHQIIAQQVFENHESIEKLHIYVSTNISKHSNYDDQQIWELDPIHKKK
jgi:hypothetical protein